MKKDTFPDVKFVKLLHVYHRYEYLMPNFYSKKIILKNFSKKRLITFY